MLQPSKRYDATKPLVLTLLFGDEGGGSHDIPDTLKISASADMTAPVQWNLQRVQTGNGGASRLTSHLDLAKGEYRKVNYSEKLPAKLCGLVRIEPVDYDASAVVVAMVLPDASIGALPESGTPSESRHWRTRIRHQTAAQRLSRHLRQPWICSTHRVFLSRIRCISSSATAAAT